MQRDGVQGQTRKVLAQIHCHSCGLPLLLFFFCTVKTVSCCFMSRGMGVFKRLGHVTEVPTRKVRKQHLVVEYFLCAHFPLQNAQREIMISKVFAKLLEVFERCVWCVCSASTSRI
jgi:hypothetical protein